MRDEDVAILRPWIDKIAAVVVGGPAGIVAYSLISLAVVTWRKAGLDRKSLHELADRLFDNDEAYSPPN